MTRQEHKEAQLRQAMECLLRDTRFQVYLDAIRELKEGAVAYAVQHTTVRDEREYLAAVGEVRAYADILAVAESHMQAIEHGLVEEKQSA